MEDEHVKLDFDQSSIFYAIRSYTPDKHKYGKNLTYEDVKENVLQNPKLKSLVAEVAPIFYTVITYCRYHLS